MNPEKLKVGDRVHNGTAIKGVVFNVFGSENWIELIWDDRKSTDILLPSSPFWMFLDRLE